MKTNETSAAKPNFDLSRAMEGVRKLIANPDDTAQAFVVIESLSGSAPMRLLSRFRADAEGQRLLASRSQIVPVLADREALRRMPIGSLGHAYLGFVEREGISADGLIAASEEGQQGFEGADGDFDYVSDRLRDTHDLWHTVTGFHGDVFGEISLLAFSYGQTRNPGVALIVLAGLLKARDFSLAKMAWRAYRNGARSQWLPIVQWESLLSLPLDEVRARLGVEPAPAYEPVRTLELRANGDLAPLSAA
jgi:ubiquinone biosynthesis protein COQ4